MSLSQHAQVRMQQRSVSPLAVELVQEFGAEERSHGAYRYALDKKARKNLRRRTGRPMYKVLKRFLDIVVVVSEEGNVITVYPRQ